MMIRIFTELFCSLLLVFFLQYTVLSAAESPRQVPVSNPPLEQNVSMPKSSKPVGHRKEISVFTLSHDGRYAMTGDEYENNFLWDIKTGELIRAIGKPDRVRIGVVAAEFSPDDSTLMWARYRKYMPVLWDVKSGKRIGVLSSKDKGHRAEIVSLAFSGDGKYVVTGDMQGTVVLWGTKDRTPVRKFKAHTGRVGVLAFIPGRGEFVSSGEDGAVRLWNVADTDVTDLKESGPGVTALAVSADGSVLYAASNDGAVRGWNVNLRNLRCTLAFDDRQINGIAISPDNDNLALVEEDQSVYVWNIRESKVVWRKVLDNSALRVMYSPSGTSIFTSGGDRWVREWDASSGTLLRKFAGVN